MSLTGAKEVANVVNEALQSPPPQITLEQAQQKINRFLELLNAARQETGCDIRPVFQIAGTEIKSDVQAFVVK